MKSGEARHWSHEWTTALKAIEARGRFARNLKGVRRQAELAALDKEVENLTALIKQLHVEVGEIEPI